IASGQSRIFSVSSGGKPRDALIPSATESHHFTGTISRVLSRRRTLSMLLHGCEEVEPRASGGPVIRRAVVCLSGRVATVHRDLLSVGPSGPRIGAARMQTHATDAPK